MASPCITLTDNGSLRPEATLSLRRLATALGVAAGETVHPVSLLHSNRIDAAKLEDRPADTFEKFAIARRESEGTDSFLVVPLFFGPSAAIAEYLPQRVDAMREEQAWPELSVQVAPCLVPTLDAADTRVAQMLADGVEKTLAEKQLSSSASVALVDHGTPRRTVTDVRNFLAQQLADLLGDKVQTVRPCSMERRDRPEYDYNEPLLERLLGQEGFQHDVIVSMLFLQPGRHAGAGGDVAEICADAETAHAPTLRTHMTGLVGTHPDLIALLAERLEEGRRTPGVSWAAMAP